MRVLVTGANGFVGRHLCTLLQRRGHAVRMACRTLPEQPGPDAVAIGDICSTTDWSRALAGCDIVVHLAGHIATGVPDERFIETNDRGVARLVAQAKDHDINLIVNLSTVSVLQGHRADGMVDDNTPAQGTSIYGVTKLAGERHVATFPGEHRRALSLRAPMLFGKNATGTWAALEKLAASGLPLPFASVTNRRSICAVENLVDAIAHLVEHDTAAIRSGSYILSDPEPVSTADMFRLVRKRMNMSSRLFAIPPQLLRMALRMAGQALLADRLLDDYEIDSSRFRTAFAWKPPLTTKDAILGATLQNRVPSGSA